MDSSRITVMAHAYRVGDGRRLFILSPRTNTGIVLRENWFDKTTDSMWCAVDAEHRINRMYGIQVPVAFTTDQLNRFWRLYKNQCRALNRKW